MDSPPPSPKQKDPWFFKGLRKKTVQPPIYTDVDKVPLSLLEQMSGHWYGMYIAKKRQHDVSISKIVWGQLLTVLVIGGASFFLRRDASALLLVGGSLIVYPTIASLFSSNAAALAASLHHGMTDDSDVPRPYGWKIALSQLVQTMAVSLLAALLVGALSGLLDVIIFHEHFFDTFVLAIMTALAVGIVGLPLTIGLVFLIRKLQDNPDDIAAPVANTIFSFLPLLAIIIFSRLIS